ncbi:hypothetical protein A2U01_0113704, partial [Trifolium medium]|nr:hypothetical protein [Trifolium medium]
MNELKVSDSGSKSESNERGSSEEESEEDCDYQ